VFRAVQAERGHGRRGRKRRCAETQSNAANTPLDCLGRLGDERSVDTRHLRPWPNGIALKARA